MNVWTTNSASFAFYEVLVRSMTFDLFVLYYN